MSFTAENAEAAERTQSSIQSLARSAISAFSAVKMVMLLHDFRQDVALAQDLEFLAVDFDVVAA